MMRVISILLAIALLLPGQEDKTSVGLEQFGRGEYSAAKSSFSDALKRTGDGTARVYLLLSRAATGECDAVLGELEREFESQSDTALQRAAGLGLAQCAVARDRFDLGFRVLQKLGEQHADDADVLFLAAKLHMKAWNDTIYRMFRAAPASYRVNQISGEIFEIQGRFSEAAAEYRKAIAKNPAALNLHFRLGRALLMESRTQEALAAARAEFEAELKLNPGDAAAEYQVGQILLAQQRSPEASARFEKALSLDPKFLEAMIALGRIRTAEKRNDEAIQLLERAVQQAPASEAARYGLMMAYRNAGRQPDAIRQKDELEKLRRPPAGEFSDFLEKLGEKAPAP
jgi:tetratricopeptide (TPR) repeat protein